MKANNQNNLPHRSTERKEVEELLNEIEIICTILVEAQENLKIVAYLSSDETNGDLVYTKRMYSFFYWIRLILWKNVILELFKLFNHADDFNIRTFLNKLGHTREFEGIIETEKTKEWKDRIKACEPIIEKVRNQRNQSIAHKDRDTTITFEKFEELNAISISEARELVDIIQKIAKEIYRVVKKTDFMIDKVLNDPQSNLEWIIEELSDRKQKRLKPLFDEARKYGLQSDLPDNEQ